MKISSITAQVRNPDRVNIAIDGAYAFSLTIKQVVDLGIKVGLEFDEATQAVFVAESAYGKLFQRALEYSLMRPRSERELKEYLYKKTLIQFSKNRKTGEIVKREGVSSSLAARVAEDIITRGYVNDEAFARFWVEHRHQRKGASRRKLEAELREKGVASSVIQAALGQSGRTDDEELRKTIEKKRGRYADTTKLMAYLARQGYGYDDIRRVLDEEGDIF